MGKKKQSCYQYSIDGVLIAKYKSRLDASNATNIPKTTIANCCIGITKIGGGFIWSDNNITVSTLDDNIPTNLAEEWRDVKGFEGVYKISSHGRAWSSRRLDSCGRVTGGYLLKSNTDSRNRVTTSIRFNGVHLRKVTARLVAEAFLPNPYNLPCVNHKDENTLNNHVSNLEWCTHEYNCNYGTRNDRIKKNMPQKKSIYQLSMDGEIIREYPSVQEASRKTGICAGHICDVCKGNREYANGYKWRYVDDVLFKKAQESLIQKQTQSAISRREKMRTKKGRVVYQYDLSDNLIGAFQSSGAVKDKYGYCRVAIINCCNGKQKTAYGFIWRYNPI